MSTNSTTTERAVEAAPVAHRPESMDRLAPYHDELLQLATRILRSRFEAEDAVQETMVRAWNALDRFDGRSQLRSWLYRICTNVSIDMRASRQRRALTMIDIPEGGLSGSAIALVAADPADRDPADLAIARESVGLALETAFRYLPPRQRAALILREVLHWSSAEIAELLDTSVASVNSALQRARATLRRARAAGHAVPSPDIDDVLRSRLNRYAEVLEAADVDALTALLAREAA